MGIISKQEFFLGLQRQKKLAKLQDSAFSLWKLFSGCLASVPYKTNKLNFRVSEWRQGVCWTRQLLSFCLTVLFLFWIVVCNLQTGRDRLHYSLFHISISSKFLVGLSSGCFSCVDIYRFIIETWRTLVSGHNIKFHCYKTSPYEGKISFSHGLFKDWRQTKVNIFLFLGFFETWINDQVELLSCIVERVGNFLLL